MQVSVLSVGGQVLITASMEPNWGLSEVLALLEEKRVPAPNARADILHGVSWLTNDVVCRDWCTSKLPSDISVFSTSSSEVLVCLPLWWRPSMLHSYYVEHVGALQPAWIFQKQVVLHCVQSALQDRLWLLDRVENWRGSHLYAQQSAR